MVAKEERTAERFAELVQVRSWPANAGSGIFGLTVAVPVADDGREFAILSLVGEWEADGDEGPYLDVLAYQDRVGAIDFDGRRRPVEIDWGRVVSLNSILHAFGRRERPLDEVDGDAVGAELHRWLGRKATEGGARSRRQACARPIA